ncbi:hypothetical protein N7462_001631 [Penicillium macrosclerotiorum]|uniref:uncharacterized protein n=1 Tax=Penicillium macrosclerotiorum TaxID=303699 RepID=UPI002548C2A0|nr:uncharacterized protein N7462_001631 [Penicillium macrosclerotiorum]KAJ5692208.1 hypothetical protein N7462_001631 [Penicillium macrosclerotiorum]
MSSVTGPHDANVSLNLHAELLPNIRQITLYISCPESRTFDGIQPLIQLSESRSAVTVSLPDPFQHVTETIKLPARVSDATRRTLNLNTAPTAKPPGPGFNHEYSFRMQIEPNDQALKPRDELIDYYVPWTAADMSSSTRIRCRVCGTGFLNTAKTDPSQHNQTQSGPLEWLWKDLPSGNWAEMMDFWHCHKPDPHEDDIEAQATAALRIEEQNAQIKGYGAASRVEAISGTVLIDVATFLLAETNCMNLKKGDQEDSTGSNQNAWAKRTLNCEKCNAIVGMDDPSAHGWRLLKANVSLNTRAWGDVTNSEEWQSHPTEMIIAAQLLELVERESARRFVVHRGQKCGLLLWVFNPDLIYSNSGSSHSFNAQQAMKVLFQEVGDVDKLLAPDLGVPSPLSVEELELPSMIYDALNGALRGSNQMLPSTARRFNEWQVGLLNRFNRDRLP